MDKSLIYVNMTDNEDIQGLKTHLELGDYWCWASQKEKVYLCRDHTPRIDKRGSNRKIWLPTQAQHQEIIGFFGASGVYEILRQLTELQMKLAYQSFEQICLVLVMQKIFHKVWDGHYWVAGGV